MYTYFADEDIQINFAVSLHAPKYEVLLRSIINRAYNVEKLIEAIQYYQKKQVVRVTFEYGLFGGVNDQLEHANN